MANNDVLIVVDVQNDFTTGALGNPDAAAKIEAIEQKARDFVGTVILTQDTHGADYLETSEGQNLPVEHCVKGTEGWELSGDLTCLAQERAWKIYEKPTFGSTELACDLVAMNDVRPIDSIELVGFCTDICVVSNALMIKAFLPEVGVRVDANLCAGTSSGAHEAALTTMRSCQIVC